jgi:predicted Abi (CAAX) family protease
LTIWKRIDSGDFPSGELRERLKWWQLPFTTQHLSMITGNYWRISLLWAIGICWAWCNLAFAQPVVQHSESPKIAVVKTQAGAISTNINNNYRANGEWGGRLILPTPEQIAQSSLVDWVWLEVQHVPNNYQQLIGQTIPLTWKPESTIATDIRQVTIDVNFTPKTFASQQNGNIHPQRLNGRSRVGSLQSLTGARDNDDVSVKLGGVTIGQENTVLIDREPTQITGNLRGLVKILGVDHTISADLPTACPGEKPCASEYFLAQHYNPQAQQFDGEIATIRIPQAPARSFGLFPSAIRDLAKSPAGSQGWYIYGDFTANSPFFTVESIQPRSLLSIAPARELEREITNANDRLDYFDRQHWQNTPQRQGQLERVGFAPRQLPKLEDKALVIHSFGGIGGRTADSSGGWQTVTGHFAYGLATVVQDDFTRELQWDINYNQIYAHNPDGIVAGKQDWATYMGNLQRGWLGTRPVSDLLITYPPVTEDYDFGGIKISPMAELQQQLHLFAARYRTGDGTGSASVDLGKSCVQDANQALYITIQRLTDRIRSQPQIQTWLTAHPQDPQTQRFQQLQALSTELQQNLTPLGIVRSDWQQNAAKLVGINQNAEFNVSNNPLIGLVSWRTMLPRGAQDGMGKMFSRLGAGMWFLNTYQVGGINPDIIPIAPTILFGQIEILSKVVLRLWSGMTTFPKIMGWLSTLGLLLAYGVIALRFGWKTGFLQFDNQFKVSFKGFGLHEIIFVSKLFFLPALFEELLFRLLLIPHPIETAIFIDIMKWSMISLAAFIIYHPLNALTFYPAGKPTFWDWRFLTLTGLLGAVCSIAYYHTGSIWSPVFIHWIVVVGWVKVFGGKRLLVDN